MKRLVLAFTLAAVPLLAQEKASPEDQRPVAVVDGQTITAAQLDDMYDRLDPNMQANYERVGGKSAFLENYIGKLLVLKEAQKSGFDKRPDVQAALQSARESALFDRYVRDVVAGSVITEDEMKRYYDLNISKFYSPEMVHLREIFISTDPKAKIPHSDEEAMSMAKKAFADVLVTIPHTDNAATVAKENAKKFAALAKAYSEDTAGMNGGDLGWIRKGTMDPEVEPAAFAVRTGMSSGIVKSRFGYYIFYVEARKAAGADSFDEAKPKVREALLAQHTQEVMDALKKLTDQLSDKAKVQVYPDNIY